MLLQVRVNRKRVLHQILERKGEISLRVPPMVLQVWLIDVKETDRLIRPLRCNGSMTKRHCRLLVLIQRLTFRRISQSVPTTALQDSIIDTAEIGRLDHPIRSSHSSSNHQSIDFSCLLQCLNPLKLLPERVSDGFPRLDHRQICRRLCSSCCWPTFVVDCFLNRGARMAMQNALHQPDQM